uniref:RNA ligase with polynucleotide kinase domain n=1 Tax=Marseillevirus LCMAC102 TaxID=2506603 RepID=A0A481YTR2_9VIRU|nr:MAG: RNA ligase with polynucleotide kinase domain [Marseillevirus LCMAC102]
MDSIIDSNPVAKRFYTKRKISDFPETISTRLYLLLNITAKEAEKGDVRIFDECTEDRLILVHYIVPMSAVYHIRGIIIDLGVDDRPKIICSGFPYTKELSPNDEKALQIKITPRTIVTNAYEGTILRMFKGRVSGKWYLSTHHKINGRQSRWSGPLFGKMFDDIWGDKKYSDFLEEHSCYIFLVFHHENRLVCSVSESKIYLVGRFCSTDDGQMVYTPVPKLCLLQHHPNVFVQNPLEISSTEELITMTKSLDCKEYTGILVTTSNENETILSCYKLVPDEYTKNRIIRGNEPNLQLRYLQLKITNKTETIRNLFPEKLELFDNIEKNITILPEYLSKTYEYRYKQGNYLRLPQEEFYVLETIRHHYDPLITLQENIQAILLTSTARQLNAMIRHLPRKN